MSYTPDEAREMQELLRRYREVGEQLVAAKSEWEEFVATNKPKWDAALKKVQAAESAVDGLLRVTAARSVEIQCAAIARSMNATSDAAVGGDRESA